MAKHLILTGLSQTTFRKVDMLHLAEINVPDDVVPVPLDAVPVDASTANLLDGVLQRFGKGRPKANPLDLDTAMREYQASRSPENLQRLAGALAAKVHTLSPPV